MVRAMIVLLLLGSAFLGWRYTQQQAVLEEYEAAVVEGGSLDKAIADTQELAHKYHQLQDLAARQGTKTSDSSSSVFQQLQSVAQIPKVAFGNLSVSKPRERTNRQGFVDATYSVEHQDSKEAVRRDRIANFFFELEQSKRRYRVTSLTLSIDGKVDDDEVPETDEWDVKFELTERKEKK